MERARGLHLLVIGDLMLDEFVWGKVGRISPEAPVPVVEVSRESSYPGGAANVARNLGQFTGRVGVLGMIGRDRQGEALLELLKQERIETGACEVTPDFPTIVKTRIIARQQQVVRVDREKIAAPTPPQIAAAVAAVEKLLPELDAIIFEDYGKGFLAQELVSKIVSVTRAAGKIIAADPNPRHQVAWNHVSVVKPNRVEAFQAAGIPWTEPAERVEDDAALHKVGAILQEKWETKLLLITLGEQGMILFQDAEAPHHVPTQAQQVFDVSGAGDTAIALFTLSLAAGGSPIEAAEIANHASAVVVGKLGTATVSPAELRRSLNHG